jgi:4-amino-4-deoxy-L-arabinose transferase-like glycosyltransferase
VPARLAAHLTRLTPGYVPQVLAGDVGLAALATLAWLAAVPLFPRAQVRPALVWATGITLSWVLLVTLLRPWAELSWGYRPIAQAVEARLPARACIGLEASGAARVMMTYHLAQRLPAAGERCAWRLEVVGRDAEIRPGAELVWEGRRPREKREVYRLYRLHDDG